MAEPIPAGLEVDQTNADLQRVVDMSHHLVVEMRDLVCQTLLVDRADLLEQDDRIAIEAMSLGIDLNMGRKLRLLDLGRDGRYDDRRAEAVADIVLKDKHRAHAALLGAYDGR